MIDLKKKWAYAGDPEEQVKVGRNCGESRNLFPLRSKRARDGFQETHKADGRMCIEGTGPWDLVPLQTAPAFRVDDAAFAKALDAPPTSDPVNHPKHYTSHPSGVECIDIVRHMSFNCGNVVKYIWREGLKDQSAPLEDLHKAMWYLADEIAKREREAGHS